MRRYTRYMIRLFAALALVPALTLGAATAKADVVSAVGLSVFSSIINGYRTTNAQRMEVGRDLAFRWFAADLVKRDKIPIVPKYGGFSSPLTDYASYDLWYVDYQLNNFMGLAYDYAWLEFDGNENWDVTSASASIEYAKWYDYFEDVEPDDDEPDENEGMVGDYYIYPINNIVSQTEYDALGNLKYEWVGYSKDYVEQNIALGVTNVSYFYGNVVGIQNKSWSGALNNKLLVNLSGRTYDFPNGTMRRGTGYSGGTTVTEDVNDTELGHGVIVRLFNIQDGTRTAEDFNWTQINYITNMVAYVSMPFSQGTLMHYDPSSSDPIYTPRPTYPDTDPIEQPTIGDPIFTEITQTSPDLQPVIDAIAVLNNNVIVGFTDMHNLLQGWFEGFAAYFDSMYQDLVRHLWTIEQLLNGLGRDVETDTPVVTPEIGDGYTPQTQLNVDLDRLMRKFPFCIPFDAYACLLLLKAPPQPIVFDFPVLLTEYTVHIDTSAMAPMAAVSRKMSTLAFVMGLLFATKKLIPLDTE